MACVVAVDCSSSFDVVVNDGVAFVAYDVSFVVVDDVDVDDCGVDDDDVVIVVVVVVRCLNLFGRVAFGVVVRVDLIEIVEEREV